MNRKNHASRVCSAVLALALAALSLLYYGGAFDSGAPAAGYISPTDTSATDTPVDTPEPPAPDTATVQVTGDLLIHKSVYSHASTGGSAYDFKPYFSQFSDVFAADLCALNLEHPVDAYGGNEKLSSFPYFNAPLELLDAVRHMGIDLCVTSNNHTFDQKLSGVQATLDNIAAAGLDSVGSYALPEDTDRLYIREVGGIRIGVCAFTEHLNGIYIPDGHEYCTVMTGRDDDGRQMMLEHIARLKEAGAEVIIACLHWGIEYQDKPSDYQRLTAQLLCDAGVDVIAGSHSHCVQPIEWLTSSDGSHRMLTIYSMGNFFANQTGLGKPKTQYGMVVSLRFVRSETGDAALDDAFYMPTLTALAGGRGADYIRLLPAGAAGDFAEKGQKAYDYVVSTVGDAIPAVSGPDDYPDGFFD